MPGQIYEITVIAFNDVGDSIASDPQSIMAASVPDAPFDLTLVAQSPTANTISWSSPYNGGTPLTDYKIWWDGASGGDISPFVEKEGSTGLVLEYTI